ncbi:MAG: ABC transporter permease [bacterium]|nr:ABC transporter permease [bacterium]
MFRIHLQLAYQSLKRQKARSLLTILALSIGIGSVVMIMSAGQGLNSLVLGELDFFSPDVIAVEIKAPGKGEQEGATSLASGLTITTLKNSDVEEIAKHPNITAVYGYLTSQEVIKYQGQNKKAIIYGEGANAPKVEKMPIARGRFYTEEEEDSLAAVVFLGSGIKDNLFGDEDAIGKNIYIRGKPFKVAGVSAKRGSVFFMDMDSLVYMPVKTLQKRLMGIDYVIGAAGKMKDASQVEETKKDLEEMMRERHDIADPSKDDFAVRTMAEARQMLETVVGGLTLLLVALVCISLIVGGVGITNIMYVSVAERTFEIGLRQAVGARRKDILWQFLLEAVLLTLAGGAVGIVLGIVAAFVVYLIAVSYGLSWVYSISLLSIILALGFSAAIGLFFGVYPARQAARLDPIVALRRE